MARAASRGPNAIEGMSRAQCQRHGLHFGAQPQREVSGLHSLPTTPTRSSLNASRSVSSRSFVEKASRVFLASYFLR